MPVLRSLYPYLLCATLQERYEYLVDDPKWQPDWLSHEQLEALRSDLDARQAVEAEFKQLLEDQHVRQLVADSIACSIGNLCGNGRVHPMTQASCWWLPACCTWRVE